MKTYWWQDKIDDYQQWHSLLVRVSPETVNDDAPVLLSGHNSRMQLQLRGYPLFWATVLRDHCGVWLIYNQDHPAQQDLLSPLRSQQTEKIAALPAEQQTPQWCRYFARDLQERSSPLLTAGEWLLRPMNITPPSAPYIVSAPHPREKWCFRSPFTKDISNADWQLYPGDLPDLQSPERVMFVDWWFGGYRLLPRYTVEPQSSRLKYWRKVAREGKLPPVLVWYISGLASYIILDGHLRLQAAYDENIPPSFIVLSQYHECSYEPDPAAIEKVQRAIAHQMDKTPRPDVRKVNQTLISLYQNRYGRHSTRSRAILGDGHFWEETVSRYLHLHQDTGYLTAILQRTEETE